MSRQGELDRAAGAALKELRKARGLSQEALAAEADMEQSLLSKVERLGPGAVGWQRFCRVASVLGCEEVTHIDSGGLTDLWWGPYPKCAAIIQNL